MGGTNAGPVGGLVIPVGFGITGWVGRDGSGRGDGSLDKIHVVASSPLRSWGIPHWRQNVSPSSMFLPHLAHQLGIDHAPSSGCCRD